MRLRGSRVGIVAGLLSAGAAGLVLALAVAAASADPVTTVTSVTATTGSPTTGSAATTTIAAVTATTTTTMQTVTSSTTTAPPPSTTESTAPDTTVARSAPPESSERASPMSDAHPAAGIRGSAARSCPVGSVVLLLPHRDPMKIEPATAARSRGAVRGGLAYPASGTLVRAASVSLGHGGCIREPSRPARSVLRSLSLFAGSVTAAEVSLSLGTSGSVEVGSLAVGGVRRSGTRGLALAVGGWALLTGGSRPVVTRLDGETIVSALRLQLLHVHAGLPAGTVVLVLPTAIGDRIAWKVWRPPRHMRESHRPLEVTPPLMPRRYVFPVIGAAEYGDTYGAFRSDVAGNWHHGDDIFAPLGTPVVAVASGTINRVGWEELGGWRLWVRDAAGDEFYYAHLSGYAPAVLRSDRVRAGQVIGFIGNTGDAFATSAHLHFEIHPRSLLHLGYDGAVDPTRYLDSWPHLEHVQVPRPVHPPLPAAPALQREARVVWRELLVARHLLRRPVRRPAVGPHRYHSAIARQVESFDARARPIAMPASAHQRDGSSATLSLVAALVVAVVGAAAIGVRRNEPLRGFREALRRGLPLRGVRRPGERAPRRGLPGD